MAKYNITEKKEKEAVYRTLVNPKVMDEMKERILEIIVMQKGQIIERGTHAELVNQNGYYASVFRHQTN